MLTPNRTHMSPHTPHHFTLIHPSPVPFFCAPLISFHPLNQTTHRKSLSLTSSFTPLTELNFIFTNRSKSAHSTHSNQSPCALSYPTLPNQTMKTYSSSVFSKVSILLHMDSTKQSQSKKRKWFLPLVFSLTLSSLLVISLIFASNNLLPIFRPKLNSPKKPIFVESKLYITPISTNPVPKIAYLISGSAGDGESLKRTLKALYHPLNQYVVHLDLESSAEERLDLVEFVRNEEVFGQVGNVRVIVRANLVTYRGPTMVSNTLHAAALLLKEGGEWDWFINLSASDYPLITQDDLLYTLSSIPRHLNFIEHTSDIGWKEYHRAKPVIIDPGLYSLKKADVFWISEKRSVPTAFNLFTGSAWMMLSRPFIDYCLWGWDNLPRTVLMYYSNFLSSPEGYFHTVICNADEFRNTTVNHDLHFISWDNPPKQHPHFLTNDDFQRMVDSNAPFARKFGHNESVLAKIDEELLGRSPNGFVPGGWFVNNKNISDAPELKPGPGAERIKQLIHGLLSEKDFDSKHCL